MTTDVEALRKKADKLRDAIEQEVSSSTMDLINELIGLEIELDSYSNL